MTEPSESEPTRQRSLRVVALVALLSAGLAALITGVLVSVFEKKQ